MYAYIVYFASEEVSVKEFYYYYLIGTVTDTVQFSSDLRLDVCAYSL